MRKQEVAMLAVRLIIIGIMFFLLVGCGPDSSANSVSGIVTYTQRIALPNDATVTVRILDVSIADAPARVIGEQLIRPAGKQVPFPYKVPFDAGDIEENYSYSLSVRIEDSLGKLLFISDTHNPVITRDSPVSGVEVIVIPVAR
jgi:putative lipoprotein